MPASMSTHPPAGSPTKYTLTISVRWRQREGATARLMLAVGATAVPCLLVEERAARRNRGNADVVLLVRADLAAEVDLQLLRGVVNDRRVHEADRPDEPGRAGEHAELMVVVGGAVDDVHLGVRDRLGKDD